MSSGRAVRAGQGTIPALVLFVLAGCARVTGDSFDTVPPASGNPEPHYAVQDQTVHMEAFGVSLSPPAEDAEAMTLGSVAVEHAQLEVGGKPSSVVATLAMFEGFEVRESLLTWVVEFEGVCVMAYGPEGLPVGSGCIDGAMTVVIDANDGAFVGAYSSVVPNSGATSE